MAEPKDKLISVSPEVGVWLDQKKQEYPFLKSYNAVLLWMLNKEQELKEAA